MAHFLVKFDWLQPYPKTATFRPEAGNMGTAMARAFREWRKQNPRKKIQHIKVEISKI